MLSITKTKKSDYLLVDADFRGLQMALAFADCGFNKNGMDKVAYDIFGPSGHCDAHSVTGFNTFISPVHGKILEITDKDGKKIIFGHEQKIRIKRKNLVGNEDVIDILGKEFKPDDEFVSYI